MILKIEYDFNMVDTISYLLVFQGMISQRASQNKLERQGHFSE